MEKNIGLVLLLLCSCVSGMPYQRAVRLQQREGSADEIVEALSDPSWKIRCLAARACGSSTTAACLKPLRELVSKDGDERVRACFIEALALRCDSDGRDLLGGITWSQDTNPGDVVATAFAEAVAGCPSADAALTLATATGAGFTAALATITPGALGKPGRCVTGPCASGDQAATTRSELEYLETLVSLEAPRKRVESALSRTRARLRELQSAARLADVKAAARVEAAELELETRRTGAEEAAAAAVRAGEFERAERLIVAAEALGAEGVGLRSMLEAGQKSAADEHLERARQLLRAQKPLAAESELQAAELLGAADEKLSKAIAASPEVRRREAEEQRKARESQITDLVERHLSTPVEGAIEVAERNQDFFGAVSSSDIVAFGEITSSVWRERLRVAQGPYQRELVAKAMREDGDLAHQLKAVRRRLEGATFSFTENSLEPLWLGDRFLLHLFTEAPELPFERTKYYYHPNSVLLNEHGHFRCRRVVVPSEAPWKVGACGLELEGLPRNLMATIEDRSHSWRWLWTGLGTERRLWLRSNPLEPTRCYSVKALRLELRDERGTKLLWTLR